MAQEIPNTLTDYKILSPAINIFKAIPIKHKKIKKVDTKLIKLCVAKGIIFTPEVFSNYTEEELKKINYYLKTLFLCLHFKQRDISSRLLLSPILLEF